MSDGGGLVIDCQSDFHDNFDTRFVVPLMPVKSAPPRTGRLHPCFVINGSDFLMATHLGTAVKRRELSPAIANFADRRLDIIGAIDVLITGV